MLLAPRFSFCRDYGQQHSMTASRDQGSKKARQTSTEVTRMRASQVHPDDGKDSFLPASYSSSESLSTVRSLITSVKAWRAFWLQQLRLVLHMIEAYMTWQFAPWGNFNERRLRWFNAGVKPAHTS